MNIWQNEIWTRFFGIAWKKLSETDPKIGAFLILHDSRTAMTDENTQKLLGFRAEPGYESLVDMLERIGKHTGFGSPLHLYLLESEKNITAGFIHLEEDTSAILAAQSLPVSTQTQLIQQMASSDSESFLALVRLEGTVNPAHSHYCILSALNALSSRLPENAVVASHAKQEFWIYIPDFSDSENAAEELIADLQQAVKSCSVTDEFGVVISSSHSMCLTVGYSIASAVPAQRLHTASFALFEAESGGAGSASGFSQEHYELQKTEFHNINLFSKLIDGNMFIYHFQPIVSARTGDIVAYEALMRTDSSIGLNPMQILDMAKRFGRLYDIEKATFRNTLDYLSNHQEDFDKRKLYINSITSHLLKDEDFEVLRRDYGELLEKVVMELTEQTEISDEKLSAIHRRLKENNMQLAIDDYGTGYSNTSNLLRYNPDIVKLDRSLIANIDADHKMQKIISNIIDFLHASGYIALAEGVETSAELKTMISFGADLIQGYYISRPKPVLLHDISDSVKKEIVRINLESSSEIKKIYQPAENETVDLAKLALEKYTGIFIGVPAVTINGAEGQPIPINITIKENTSCTVTLKNTSLTSNTDEPAIRIMGGCDVKIECVGSNKLSFKGILVPRNASLTLIGAGDLSVSSEALNCFGIGCGCEQSCGSITVGMTGKLSVSVNGERCIGIGGGKNKDSNKINLLAGDISVNCSGGECVGIGTFDGNAMVNLSDCCYSFGAASKNSVAIGAASGNADINMRNFKINVTSSGGTMTAIGVISGGSGKISMTSGRLDVSMKGRNIACIGTCDGDMDCEAKNAKIQLYCEGTSVSGIGDFKGGGNVDITDCDLAITFLTGEGIGLGSPNGKLTVTRGTKCIKINE